MEIKQPADLPQRSPGLQTRDLLSLLRAAGTIEAEVLELLPHQLLLKTSLGQILTSNRLPFEAGDRILLRLDRNGEQPVLKASQAPVRPRVLASHRHPELGRLLELRQPRLASVVRASSGRLEIRIGEQNLTLPGQASLVRGQLLSLRLNKNRAVIEIQPLDKKPIYKAILKQLLPQQSIEKPVALVKLLGRVAGAGGKTAAPSAESGARSLPHRPKPRPVSAQVGARPGAPGETLAPPVAAPIIRGQPLPSSSARIDSSPRQPDPSGTRATAEPVSTKTLPAAAARPRALPIGANPNHRTSTVPEPGQRGKAAAGISRSSPAGRSPAIHERATPAAKIEPRAAPAPRTTESYSAPLPTPAQTAAPARAGPGQIPAANGSGVNTGQPGPWKNPPGAPSLQATALPPFIPAGAPAETPVPWQFASLLRVIPKFAEFDAARVKQWFLFSGLFRSKPAQGETTANLDPFKILRQLAEQYVPAREFPAAKARHSGHALAASQVPAQDNPLWLIRDGARLLEQLIAHNHLQRASIGLQQEAQHPLSLSFALPIIDAQQVRPLHIELAQRNRAQRADQQTWDIRLSFDFTRLGPMTCHLVLAGFSVAASFYCTRESTRDQVERALPELRRQLAGAGFEPGELHSFPGGAATPKTGFEPPPEALLDIEV